MNKFELQPIDNFPPDFDGRDQYVGSVRKTLGIEDNETGRVVREKMRSVWEASKGEEDGFSTRYKIMEVLFGDRVGSEFGGLGAFALHITDPMSYDDFLGIVPSGYMWRQEDLDTLSAQAEADAFPYMHAAAEAAKTVRPGNELQEEALRQIRRLAFQAEVAKVFPETKSE